MTFRKIQVSEHIFERIYERAKEDSDYLRFIGLKNDDFDENRIREKLLEVYDIVPDVKRLIKRE